MRSHVKRLLWLVWGFALVFSAAARAAGTEDASAPPQIERRSGIDAKSAIHYVQFLLKGQLRGLGETASGDAGGATPMLVAQCTSRPDGRYGFELFVSFGEARDFAFHAPWTPATPQDLFPPSTEKATITMEFFGYTHVKPLRRQWEIPVETPGVYRYNPPGRGSSNMEEIAYDLRYMLALPTVRFSTGTRSAEFMTAPLLVEIHAEPLCRAAGL